MAMVDFGLENGNLTHMDNKLKETLDGLKTLPEKNNMGVVIIVGGKSGLGKTTFCHQIARYLDPTYNMDDEFYDFDDMKKSCMVSPPMKSKDLDESMGLSSRNALTKRNKDMQLFLSVVRSRRLFLIFNITDVFDLDKSIVLDKAHIYFHIYSSSITSQGKFCAYFKPVGDRDYLKDLYITGKAYHDYSKVLPNYRGRFTKEFILDQKEYDKKKDKAIEKMLVGQEKDTSRLSKAPQVAENLIMHLRKKKYSNVKIAEIGGVSTETIRNFRLNYEKRMEKNPDITTTNEEFNEGEEEEMS